MCDELLRLRSRVLVHRRFLVLKARVLKARVLKAGVLEVGVHNFARLWQLVRVTGQADFASQSQLMQQLC
jgi:hypothetical protein